MNLFFEPNLLWLTILFFAGVTIFFALKVSNYVAVMTTNTKLGGAFSGLVIISGISSLPELVTIVTSTANDNSMLAISDVMGANIMTIMFMSVSFIIFFHRVKFSSTSKNNKRGLIFSLTNFALFFIALLLAHEFNFIPSIKIGSINISIVLLISLVIYITVVVLAKDGEDEVEAREDNVISTAQKTILEEKEKVIEKGNEMKHPLKWYIWMTALSSMLLVGSAVILTMAADKAASPEGYDLGHALAGALLLALITSLPEVISVFNLTRIGMRNLALGSAIGSHTFNFALLFIGDIIVRDNIVSNVASNDSNRTELMALSVLGILLGIMLFITFTNKLRKSKIKLWINYIIVLTFIVSWVLIKTIL